MERISDDDLEKLADAYKGIRHDIYATCVELKERREHEKFIRYTNMAIGLMAGRPVTGKIDTGKFPSDATDGGLRGKEVYDGTD